MIPKTITTELKTPTHEHSGVAQDFVDDATAEYGKLGQLVFKLRYLTERSALVVSVVRCRGLPGRVGSQQAELANGGGSGGGMVNGNISSKNATDPYVKLQLLPEKQHKVKTR
jgi:synaptotagmin-4